MTVSGAALLALGIVAGLVAGGLNTPASPARAVVCRPTAPDMALRPDERAVLYLGNSLVFDHGWSIPGSRPVNCARQGMVARDLDVARLPALDPDLIVLGFGTVEAIRAARTGDAPETARFSETLRSRLSALGERYPDADIALLGVPPLPAHPKVPIAPLNAALAALAANTGALWLPLDRAAPYDGIHLPPEDYRQWEEDIAAHLTLSAE